MSSRILPDTDVLVDFFRGYPAAVDMIKTHADYIVLSSIVIAELFAGVRGEAERSDLEDFISLFPVIPVSAEIAVSGGLLKRKFGKTHGVGLADAIIAATAECVTATLKTLNIKHYPMIQGIKPAYRKKH